MTDTIIGLLLDYWMFTAVAVLILIGWIANLFGVDQNEDIVGFKYNEMPHMMPIRAGKGIAILPRGGLCIVSL